MLSVMILEKRDTDYTLNDSSFKSGLRIRVSASTRAGTLRSGLNRELPELNYG